MILSGLKTLLETGEQLTTPGSLRYSRACRARSIVDLPVLWTGKSTICYWAGAPWSAPLRMARSSNNLD